MKIPSKEVMTPRKARLFGLSITRTKSTVTCPSFLKSQAHPKKVMNRRRCSVTSSTPAMGRLKKYFRRTLRQTASVIMTIMPPINEANRSRMRSKIAIACFKSIILAYEWPSWSGPANKIQCFDSDQEGRYCGSKRNVANSTPSSRLVARDFLDFRHKVGDLFRQDLPINPVNDG